MLLLHITDTHLYGTPGHTLKGICTRASCAAVIEKARRRFPGPDAILLGGDMSQDHSPASYRQLAGLLRPWRVPFMLTPGNHADMGAIRNSLIPALDALSSFRETLHGGRWQVICLNSHADGQVAGHLAADELKRLDRQLDEYPHSPALLALHHPPLAIGSRWMDDIGLANADAFWGIVEKHPQVRAVLCGHIHQELDIRRGDVRVLGTPATCIQFRPGHDTFALDDLPPGYRWLKLLPDGAIDTGIERIEGFVASDLQDCSFY